MTYFNGWYDWNILNIIVNEMNWVCISHIIINAVDANMLANTQQTEQHDRPADGVNNHLWSSSGLYSQSFIFSLWSIKINVLIICCASCESVQSTVPESREILSGVLGLAGRCSTSTWISSVSSGLVRRRGLMELAFLLRGLLLLWSLLPPPLLSPGSLRSTRSRAVDRTAGRQGGGLHWQVCF